MIEQDDVMEAPVPVRVKGVYIAESERNSPAPVVLLEDDKARIVPIFVGLSEAISIHHALLGELSPRPMTHDLFITVLENLSASIKSDSTQSEIDARPSDCLALALRAKAPIEVQEKVVIDSNISKSEVEKLTSIDNYLQ